MTLLEPTSKRAVCTSLVLAALAIGGLFVASTNATPTAVAKSKRLVFRGDTVSNSIKGGCYGPVGIYASIDVCAPNRLSSAGVNRLARASKPRRARVRINRRWYSLAIDKRVSGVAYHRVWWTFKRVQISKGAARKLVGKKASISYEIGAKTSTTKRAKVRNGSCE